MAKVIEIGLPCSPAKFISADLFKVIKLLVTYGGGMGGTSKVFHCIEVKKGEKFYEVILLTGECRKINPAYIVEESYPEVVKVITDMTEHVNFHSKVCNIACQTRFIELPYGGTYKLVNKYVYEGDSTVKVISDSVEKL
jgi:hypothetical protein